MVDEPTAMIAVCGLDCGACHLFKAHADEQAAEALVDWFRAKGWLKETEGKFEIMQRGPYCRGCHGDRSVQWSGDCTLRACCMDEKRLLSCTECQSFPCQRLTEWSQKTASHAQALQHLHVIQRSLGQGGAERIG